MDAEATEFPRFKACFEPIVDKDDGLFLLREGDHVWLPDPVYAALAPMLDGAHSIDAIFSELCDGYPSERIYGALGHLRAEGYLADDATVGNRPERAFWERFGVPPTLARSRLRSARVSVVALGDIDPERLIGLIDRQGVKVVPDGDWTVVVADDYLRDELATHNARSLALGSPWLLTKPVGVETWIGPMFAPGRTACWECLAQRLRGRRRLETYLASRRGGRRNATSPRAFLASTLEAALAEAATEVVRAIALGGASPLLGRIVSTDAATLERQSHGLTRRPQCPACGAGREDRRPVPPPPVLRERRKIDSMDGGHRARSPAETLTNLERHISPISGIVSTIVPGARTSAPSRGDSWPTQTFAADHNFSDMHDERFFLREGLRLRSGGKGKSVEQARISALAESLERYSGVFDGTEPRIRAAFADLDGAIPPNACMGYSERQYAERERHNAKGHKAHWVPEPFRRDVEIEWTPLWSLTAQATRYLPTSLCYFGYRSADPVFGRADSNGCAAGAVLEEAVLQGFLELVERDAVALWWYNRLSRPGVDLDSAEDPYVGALVSHYRSIRRDLWALDVTSDFGVPAFAALSRRSDKPEEDIIYGFGAHLDPAVALVRAMTELNQSLEAVPAASGLESNRTYRGVPDAVRWWRTATLANQTYLAPDPSKPRRRLEDFANLAAADLLEDIKTCQNLAAARGVEILVLDQTRPDVGLPVVRVVAPGLRHFWARFGPGRLYDAPVREGWLAEPKTEDELNPFVVQF
jgi:oxazoline/thiazoline synthase